MTELGQLLLAVLLLVSAPVWADCFPTPHRTTGTHYEPVTEEQDNVGPGVAVRGRILAALAARFG